MDRRTALKKIYPLEFVGKNGGKFVCTIERELGRGSTCIVYEAAYETNAGDRKLVSAKECYPFGLGITRLDSGELFAAENSDKFEACKRKITKDFKLENDLFFTNGLTDLLVNTFDVYRVNNTVYIASSYLKTACSQSTDRPRSNCV